MVLTARRRNSTHESNLRSTVRFDFRHRTSITCSSPLVVSLVVLITRHDAKGIDKRRLGECKRHGEKEGGKQYSCDRWKP